MTRGPVCLGDIERIRPPSLEDFHERYLRARRPVIIEGVNDSWPARTRWTPEYLKGRFGTRPVRVATLDERGVTKYEHFETIPFDTFCDAITQESPPAKRYYLVLGNVMMAPKKWQRRSEHLAVLPELAEDLEIPVFVNRDTLFEVNYWTGYPGASSNLHFDLVDNLLTMVTGQKKLMLFAPDQTKNLYPPAMIGSAGIHSPVDVKDPDYGAYPLYADASYWRVELNPGDGLFMPSGWWHYVHSQGFNQAVNFWWRAPSIEWFKTPMRRMLPEYLLAGPRAIKSLVQQTLRSKGSTN